MNGNEILSYNIIIFTTPKANKVWDHPCRLEQFYTYEQKNQLWNVHKTAVLNIKSTVALVLFSEISSTEKT